MQRVRAAAAAGACDARRDGLRANKITCGAGRASAISSRFSCQTLGFPRSTDMSPLGTLQWDGHVVWSVQQAAIPPLCSVRLWGRSPCTADETASSAACGSPRCTPPLGARWTHSRNTMSALSLWYPIGWTPRLLRPDPAACATGRQAQLCQLLRVSTLPPDEKQALLATICMHEACPATDLHHRGRGASTVSPRCIIAAAPYRQKPRRGDASGLYGALLHDRCPFSR